MVLACEVLNACSSSGRRVSLSQPGPRTPLKLGQGAGDMVRAAYPRIETSCKRGELRSFVGSAALYFDFAQLVDLPKTFPREQEWQTISRLEAVCHNADAVHAAEYISACKHPRIPAFRPGRRSTLPVRSRKLVKVGGRRTVVMCQFAVTGLIRASPVRPPVTSHNPSGALSYARSDLGPVCVTELFDSSSAPPCSDFSPGISRHWNTRGHLLVPPSPAHGGLGCWLLAAG